MKRAAFPLVALLTLVPFGCDKATCEETLSCPSYSDGAPPGCAKDPKEDPSCVIDSIGIFVSPKGSDDADGTKVAPLRTLGSALKKRNGRAVIFVCEGRYEELLSLGAGDGVSIYGGFTCDGWAFTGAKPTIGKGAEALRIRDLASTITISDVRLTAGDASTPGGSSIAATVVGAAGVTFKRVAFEAGAGVKGADGVAGVTGTSDKAPDGEPGTGATPGASRVCTCSAGSVALGTTTGGAGGGANGGGVGGLPLVTPPDPLEATGVAGAGGSTCATGGTGKNGSNGPRGADPPTKALLGNLTAGAWTPESGAAGENGKIGQGGGGGAGQAGGAGGGGCGGCPGTGSTGGGGGGASAALISETSSIQLVDSELKPGKAGAGGAGGAAGAGASGGSGKGAVDGCTGGNGGRGGDGGTGAGGAGGISVGVLYKGTKPTLTQTVITPGTAGQAGKGKPGVNDGPAGVAQETLEAP